LENSPDRIPVFNIDETAQTSDIRGGQVFVSKKAKNSYMASSDGGKMSFTVTFCCSAAGEFMLPLTLQYRGGKRDNESHFKTKKSKRLITTYTTYPCKELFKI